MQQPQSIQQQNIQRKPINLATSESMNQMSDTTSPTTFNNKTTLNMDTTPPTTLNNSSLQKDIPSARAPPKFQLQKSFAHELPEDARNEGWYAKMVDQFGGIAGTLGSIPCCICCPNPYKRVVEGRVGMVLKFGKYSRAVDPGLVKVNPLSEKLQMVEIALQVLVIPEQNATTKDNVTIHLTSVIYYCITDPYKATFGISNIAQALVERTQTTLRHVIGARVLQDVIEHREAIAAAIHEIIEGTAEGWGVQVESILIKDINFSRELQESLSMAAQSKRIGESKVIVARAEVESAKLMRQAADVLASPAAMQLRMLEAYQAMAKTSGAKVIFMPGVQNADNAGKVMNSSGSGGYQESGLDGQGLDTRDPAFQQAMQSQVIQNI